VQLLQIARHVSFQTPLENVAATRLTFETVLPNLLSVNELRVARDLLAGLARRTKLPARFLGLRRGGGREHVTGWLGRQDSNLGMTESKSALRSGDSSFVLTVRAAFIRWRINHLGRLSEQGHRMGKRSRGVDPEAAVNQLNAAFRTLLRHQNNDLTLPAGAERASRCCVGSSLDLAASHSAAFSCTHPFVAE
jgi:hypothetical protein